MRLRFVHLPRVRGGGDRSSGDDRVTAREYGHKTDARILGREEKASERASEREKCTNAGTRSRLRPRAPHKTALLLQVAQAKHPSDFIDVFRVKDVRIVIRLNSHDYDKSVFTNAGFQHHDLFFSDCSVPSDDLVDQVVFISCERGECSNAEGRDWTEDTAVTAAECCWDSG